MVSPAACGRGLKLLSYTQSHEFMAVARRVRAWIETMLINILHQRDIGRPPRAGVD